MGTTDTSERDHKSLICTTLATKLHMWVLGRRGQMQTQDCRIVAKTPARGYSLLGNGGAWHERPDETG